MAIQGTGASNGTHSWTEGNASIPQHLPLPTENKLSLEVPKPVKDFFHSFQKEKLTLDQVKNRQDLSGKDLSGLNLAGLNLVGKNLKNSILRHTILEGANLQGANLQGADLVRANLQNANLKDANLSKADFQLANMKNADVEGANIEGAHFNYDQFENIKGKIDFKMIPKIHIHNKWGGKRGIVGVCLAPQCFKDTSLTPPLALGDTGFGGASGGMRCKAQNEAGAAPPERLFNAAARPLYRPGLCRWQRQNRCLSEPEIEFGVHRVWALSSTRKGSNHGGNTRNWLSNWYALMDRGKSRNSATSAAANRE